jgi:hypothetical protein
MPTITPPMKAWKVRPQSNLAFMKVGEKWATIAGSKAKNFVTADSGGVSIGGPISYQGLPGQMTFAGLLTFPPFYLMFLPIGPSLVPSLALPKLAINMAKLTASLSGLVG